MLIKSLYFNTMTYFNYLFVYNLFTNIFALAILVVGIMQTINKANNTNEIQNTNTNGNRIESSKLQTIASAESSLLNESLVENIDANYLLKLFKTNESTNTCDIEKNRILTLDFRSQNEFNKSHFINSFNLSITKMLLKRTNLNSIDLEPFITSNSIIDNNKSLGRASMVSSFTQKLDNSNKLVIIISNNNNKPDLDMACLFCKRFQIKGYIYKGIFKDKYYYLDRLDQEILQKYLIKDTNTSYKSSSRKETAKSFKLNIPKINNNNIFNTGLLTCPSSNNNIHNNKQYDQFYNSIMQYNIINTVNNDENIKNKIKIDINISSLLLLLYEKEQKESNKTKVPTYMIDILKDNKIMLSNFHLIEKEEENRIKTMLKYEIEKDALNSNNVSPLCDQEMKYSIKAGLEKGDKNRYSNIWPYEYNRVKLKSLLNNNIGNQNTVDYINASFVQETNTTNKYIATQAPTDSTCFDFWQCIWEQNIQVVIMLTKLIENGRSRCIQYWPHDPSNLKLKAKNENIHSEFEIELINEYHIDQYSITITELRLFINNTNAKNNGKDKTQSQRVLYHINYKGWPDYGIPKNKQDMFVLYQLNKYYKSITNNQVLVHCSAGCGRTGTFIAIDSIIDYYYYHKDSKPQQNRDFNQDLVYDIVRKLRKQRIKMVQTVEQLKFCYEITIITFLLTEKNNTNHRIDEIMNLSLIADNKNIIKDYIELMANTDFTKNKISPKIYDINNVSKQNKPNTSPNGYFDF